jgi:hypothetical protein
MGLRTQRGPRRKSPSVAAGMHLHVTVSRMGVLAEDGGEKY